MLSGRIGFRLVILFIEINGVQFNMNEVQLQYVFTISTASSTKSDLWILCRRASITFSNSEFRRAASSIECDAFDNRKDREDR